MDIMGRTLAVVSGFIRRKFADEAGVVVGRPQGRRSLQIESGKGGIEADYDGHASVKMTRKYPDGEKANLSGRIA
jgi:hypothetical protein